MLYNLWSPKIRKYETVRLSDRESFAFISSEYVKSLSKVTSIDKAGYWCYIAKFKNGSFEKWVATANSVVEKNCWNSRIYMPEKYEPESEMPKITLEYGYRPSNDAERLENLIYIDRKILRYTNFICKRILANKIVDLAFRKNIFNSYPTEKLVESYDAIKDFDYSRKYAALARSRTSVKKKANIEWDNVVEETMHSIINGGTLLGAPTKKIFKMAANKVILGKTDLCMRNIGLVAHGLHRSPSARIMNKLIKEHDLQGRTITTGLSNMNAGIACQINKTYYSFMVCVHDIKRISEAFERVDGKSYITLDDPQDVLFLSIADKARLNRKAIREMCDAYKTVIIQDSTTTTKVKYTYERIKG